VDETVWTLAEYCQLEKISRSRFYQEQWQGIGVEYFKRGSKIYVANSARLRHREKLLQRTKVAAEAGAQ
jgi:hypothetical protein